MLLPSFLGLLEQIRHDKREINTILAHILRHAARKERALSVPKPFEQLG
jgi:hypothetical protein